MSWSTDKRGIGYLVSGIWSKIKIWKSTHALLRKQIHQILDTRYQIRLAFLLILFSGSFCASAATFQKIAPGIEYVQLLPSPDSATTLHVLRLDLKQVRVKVLDARDFKSSALSAKQFAEKSGSLVAINANFFNEKQQPLGLILQDGKLKKPPQNTAWWGVLLLDGHAAKIGKIASADETKGFDEGVQSGPRLVVSGKNPKLKSEYSPKSAVGLDRKGRLYLIASEGSMNIQDLAKFLALSEKQGGLALVDALNLDGGSSTQLFAKVGDLKISVTGFNQVPIGLGVFRR